MLKSLNVANNEVHTLEKKGVPTTVFSGVTVDEPCESQNVIVGSISENRYCSWSAGQKKKTYL